jgi:hypothetical protein
MKEKEITCNEMLLLFEDAYCEGKHVVITLDYFGTPVTIQSDYLEIYDIGDNISANDISDNSFTIRKQDIRNIKLMPEDLNDKIILDLGDHDISFVICNY